MEIFLRNFKINSVYLDPENPINTNVHYAAQFLKGVFPVLITHTHYNSSSQIAKFSNFPLGKKSKKKGGSHVSPEFALEIVDESLVHQSVIFFDCINPYLLEDHACKDSVSEIIHIINSNDKATFSEEYENINENIHFTDFEHDDQQVMHLRYRCEDVYYQIKKADIVKTKLKKINQELLNSKAMKNYFKDNQEERNQVVKTIAENSIRTYKPSVGYLPSYLVHEENKDNVIKSAIEESYFQSKKKKAKNLDVKKAFPLKKIN